MKFFDQKLIISAKTLVAARDHRIVSDIYQMDVLPETIRVLDNFYRPYNIRLAQLLQHDKWLFER